MKHYYTHSGARLYSTKDLAEMTGRPVVHIRAWFSDGSMRNFFTAYEVHPGRLFYKAGPPDKDDKLIKKDSYVYKYRPWEGGRLCESPNNPDLEIPLLCSE